MSETETSAFAPFANDAQQTTIDTLSVDNGTDEIIISGTLSIPKSKEGLQIALELQKKLIPIITQTAKILGETPNLPEHIEIQSLETGTTDVNPFA